MFCILQFSIANITVLIASWIIISATMQVKQQREACSVFGKPSLLALQDQLCQMCSALELQQTTNMNALSFSNDGICSSLLLVPGTVCSWHSFYCPYGFPS